MVTFDPAKHPEFTDTCAVNCNNIFITDWTLFAASARGEPVGNLKGTGKIREIVAGGLKSKLVPSKILKILGSETEKILFFGPKPQ